MCRVSVGSNVGLGNKGGVYKVVLARLHDTAVNILEYGYLST